jgi:outer membrane protein insertion porin family
MKKHHFIAFLASTMLMTAPIYPVPTIEGKKVEKIEVTGGVREGEGVVDPNSVLARMKTHRGDFFSQSAFDEDLKVLSNEFYRVEPKVEVVGDSVIVKLKVWAKPIIRQIDWIGLDHLKQERLQKELAIVPGKPFDQQAFNEAFQNVKAYLVKKGYFEAKVDYKTTVDTEKNAIDIEILIDEGRMGRVESIEFDGFSKQEQNALIEMIMTKKYQFLMSWATGEGTYNQEMAEQDRFIVVNYLQNQGYADAKVKMEVVESTSSKRIILKFTADKGEIYTYGDITIQGYTLFTEQEIRSRLKIKSNGNYSPERVRDSLDEIRSLYGRKGYIETVVNYETQIDGERPVYHLKITIDEGRTFRVGMIKIFGNRWTETKVILHETTLIPGDQFNLDKLKETERRLMNIGYFESVNVYAVKSASVDDLGENFRDVHVEVKERPTGDISLSLGFSSSDSFIANISLTEKNFKAKGLGDLTTQGYQALRGGGEYASIRVGQGLKSHDYGLSWTKPHFKDTPWTVGFDVSHSANRALSELYELESFALAGFGSYTLNSFWRTGVHARYRNMVFDAESIESDYILNHYFDRSLVVIPSDATSDEEDRLKALDQAQKNGSVQIAKKLERLERSSGALLGTGAYIAFDSTNRPIDPSRGFKSKLDFEYVGWGLDHTFIGVGYYNSFYHSFYRGGITKLRGDLHNLFPLGNSTPENLPLQEKLFIGGETTVRGYVEGRIGPRFDELTVEPSGGISSAVASIEHLHFVNKIFDLFVFIDAGAASDHEWNFGKVYMTYGFGTRLRVIPGGAPIVLGLGWPIQSPDNELDTRKFFFSMGGRF